MTAAIDPTRSSPAPDWRSTLARLADRARRGDRLRSLRALLARSGDLGEQLVRAALLRAAFNPRSVDRFIERAWRKLRGAQPS